LGLILMNRVNTWSPNSGNTIRINPKNNNYAFIWFFMVENIKEFRKKMAFKKSIPVLLDSKIN
jgi:hypothetical protein